MDFYLSIDGSKQGPYSIFKVGDLLDSGEVTADTLAWHRDLEGWKPIREIAALEPCASAIRRHAGVPAGPAPLPAPPPVPHARERWPFPGRSSPDGARSGYQAVTRSSHRARPFVRFWARMFDYTAVSVLVFQFSDFVIPHRARMSSFADLFTRYLEEMQKPEALNFARTLFLSLIGWHLLEAVLIHLFGTTPGKALFGLKVKTEAGEAIPMLASLGRSFYVYVMGVGFYQFPFILIGMVFSFFGFNQRANFAFGTSI